MEINFLISGNIDPIAAYAALLSTAIAILEYVKWNKRNYLDVTCNVNMIFFPSTNNQKYIIVIATNKGQAATTITHLALYYWPNFFGKIFNSKRQQFIIKSHNIPKIINPGERWHGNIEQSVDLEKMASEGLLYGVIFHSMGKNEILCRIKIIDKNKL